MENIIFGLNERIFKLKKEYKNSHTHTFLKLTFFIFENNILIYNTIQFWKKVKYNILIFKQLIYLKYIYKYKYIYIYHI